MAHDRKSMASRFVKINNSMKNFKALTFIDFLVENFDFENEMDNVSIPTEISDEEKAYRRYKEAREYITHMLGSIGNYNSEQAQVMMDRTVRKFDLDDEQRKALEIDVFDWENRDNDDMNAGIEESARLTVPQMDKDVKHLKHWGWRNKKVKTFEEWNPLS